MIINFHFEYLKGKKLIIWSSELSSEQNLLDDILLLTVKTLYILVEFSRKFFRENGNWNIFKGKRTLKMEIPIKIQIRMSP